MDIKRFIWNLTKIRQEKYLECFPAEVTNPYGLPN